jgi:hypothetical protein
VASGHIEGGTWFSGESKTGSDTSGNTESSVGSVIRIFLWISLLAYPNQEIHHSSVIVYYPYLTSPIPLFWNVMYRREESGQSSCNMDYLWLSPTNNFLSDMWANRSMK